MKKYFLIAILAAACASASATHSAPGSGAGTPSMEQLIQTLKGLEANRNNCSANFSAALARHKSRAVAGVPWSKELARKQKELSRLSNAVLRQKCTKAGYFNPKDVHDILNGGKKIPESEFRDPFVQGK